VHAAIVVGPSVLEWGPASVCVPTPADQWEAENVSLALDVFPENDATAFASSRDKIRSLCETVAEWNANKFYAGADIVFIFSSCQTALSKMLTPPISTPGDKNKLVTTCNTQHFVDACLKALGFAPAFMGVRGACMQQLKFGSSEETRETSTGSGSSAEGTGTSQRDLFPLKTIGQDFASHAAIDQYVSENRDSLARGEMLALAIFDRVCWLRWAALDAVFDDSEQSLAYEELTELDACAPLLSESEHRCAFGLPLLPFGGID
jgi:hypothetical protein